jgi:hypothetical protein
VRCRDRNSRLFKVPGQVCSRRSLVGDVEFEVKVLREFQASPWSREYHCDPLSNPPPYFLSTMRSQITERFCGTARVCNFQMSEGMEDMHPKTA